MTVYLSRNVYPSVDGSTTSFALSFPFLQRAHVHVYVTPPGSNTPSEVFSPATWSWSSDSLITFVTAPVALSTVTIQRMTPDDALIDELQGASTLTAEELNTISLQLLFLIQEALDNGAGLGDISGLIDALRWTYDVSLSSSNAWGTGVRIGPVPVEWPVYLPADAVGSFAKGYDNTLSVDHVIAIRKNGATSCGTITVASADLSVTFDVPADVLFNPGDDVSLVTLTDGGLTNLGVTLRMRRVI